MTWMRLISPGHELDGRFFDVHSGRVAVNYYDSSRYEFAATLSTEYSYSQLRVAYVAKVRMPGWRVCFGVLVDSTVDRRYLSTRWTREAEAYERCNLYAW